MEHIFEGVAKKIDSYKDAMISLQRELIPIKAISPMNGGTGELKKAKFLEQRLKELFGDVKWINAPHAEADGGIRPNLLAILPGKDQSKTIWFMAHMDVVPEGDRSSWDTDPFEATVKDGKIYGRGAEDNHQGLVSSFFAIKAIKEENIIPPYNVGLLIVSDEETGSNCGIKYILKNHPNLFKKEGQFIVPDFGVPTGELIEIAEKGLARFKLTVIGKQSHVAYPNRGLNANRAISNLIVRLDKFRTENYTKENSLFEPAYCTMEATTRYANNVSLNTISGKEIQVFDCRILPDYDFDGFVAGFKQLTSEIEKEFGVTIEIEQLLNDKPSYTPPESTPIVSSLKKAIKVIYNADAKMHGIGGGTVGRFLRYSGLKAVVWSKNDQTMHSPNEYCHIDDMISDSKVFAHVILGL